MSKSLVWSSAECRKLPVVACVVRLALSLTITFSNSICAIVSNAKGPLAQHMRLTCSPVPATYDGQGARTVWSDIFDLPLISLLNFPSKFTPYCFVRNTKISDKISMIGPEKPLNQVVSKISVFPKVSTSQSPNTDRREYA